MEPSRSDQKAERLLFRLKWPFSKKDLDAVLSTVERYKSSLALATASEHTRLAVETQRCVQDLKENIEKQKDDSTRLKIIRWLSTTDPSSNFHSGCEGHQSTSGSWVLNHTSYKNWSQSPNSFLWLHGIPGCGKTTLR
ncbi:ankyrin repeat protein [Glarea lozoyensis ATCC 20868]|uniref:Ankyrin repeat protein n=1 Tax=Glarea lozoyensis (strain ATCC 20868 / MF5171) TaxID=1116229 RepID=S3DH81_GLAL2|nr:ankyrin repeat protein [Glarea lozoyensis ATCC 20868]EPE31376.1 ankyrin repeat protein [Glarea lozoyensis ATCC 20868]